VKLRRIALLVAGVVLLAASLGFGISQNRARRQQDRDRRVSDQAMVQGKLLSEYFERARTLTLLSAQNPAFATFYDAPGSRNEKVAAGGPIMAQVTASLSYLETLYPNHAVSEVCFINATGPENARVVGNHVAGVSELSADESSNAFFAPTFALEPGDVYQAAPYVSPDTRQWVISNSTPLPLAHGRALLHFEVSLDSFRAALSDAGKDETVVVDATNGDVVLDAHHPLVVGGPLGAPDDRRYPELAHLAESNGLMTIAGQRVAFQRVATVTGNANHWLVVATGPLGDATLLSSLGLGSGLLLLAGLFVLGFAVSSFRASQSQLQKAALTDGLTGLPNRTLLSDRISQGIHTANRAGKSAAVLMVDLDRFKEVNDTLGHHKGDLVLIEAGHRLTQAVRAADSVARLGGDEFAVYLDSLDRGEDALVTAERIVRTIAEPFVIDGLPIQIGASVGVATYPAHADDSDALMQYADVAMYHAKRARCGYRLYDSRRDDHSERRLQVAAELNAAITDHRLVVHYQPKIDLLTGATNGVEALVRWNHPTLGLILPDEFISIAEDTGLITALTSDVLGQALEQCRAWLDAGAPHTVAVNLSARCLVGDDLPDTVAAALHKWGLNGDALMLEITETAIIDDEHHAAAILEALHQLGVRLSIDDFGTGYFSMTGLRNLPIDEIKIDQSFVSTMTSEQKDAFIVRSTIALGHNLGLRVVAEGVEEPSTLDELRALGCDSAQGFLISRPLPAQDLMPWLVQSQRFNAATTSIPNSEIATTSMATLPPSTPRVATSANAAAS
jgi:diguanylate cyclase (GGDEF)-like protein